MSKGRCGQSPTITRICKELTSYEGRVDEIALQLHTLCNGAGYNCRRSGRECEPTDPTCPVSGVEPTHIISKELIIAACNEGNVYPMLVILHNRIQREDYDFTSDRKCFSYR